MKRILSSKSVKVKYLYNLVYQLFALLTPLVTTPYVARVLGSSGVGKYTFSYSINNYFCLFGAMGFGIYAQREIARKQDNKKVQSLVFWEIIIARSIFVFGALLIYFLLIYLGVFGENYTPLMTILSLNLVAILVDVTFFYQGNEEFGLIALRNILVKIIGVALIFILVRSSEDVWIYTLCQSGTLLVSNISLWTGLKKRLVSISIGRMCVRRHFAPTFRLFIPTIAVSVYTMLDNTLIGLLIPGFEYRISSNGVNTLVKTADLENGYYDQAEKIIKMAATVITSLGTVMIPRNSQIVAAGKYDEFRSNIYGALRYVSFIGIPMVFGIAALASNIVPWYLGAGYEKVPLLMMMFSPLILIIGLTNVIGSQYLLPMGEDRKYTQAICIGAVVNFILDNILIRLFWSYGACIATLLAESVVMLCMFHNTHGKISLFKWLQGALKQILAGVIMFCVVYILQVKFEPSIINSLCFVIIGSTIYFIILFIIKDMYFMSVVKKIYMKMHRN